MYTIQGYGTENSSKRIFEGRISQRPPNRRRGRYYWKQIAIVIAFLLVMQYFMTGCLVTRADNNALRNLETGILTGAESRTLGPKDAPSAVLLVHGFVGCGNNFAGLPEQLAQQGYFVRVMLLPGHGTSPRDLKSMDEGRMLSAIEGELAELRRNHRHVFLAGHSMGGALSTITASKIPVDGLVLVAPYFGVTHHWYYGLRVEQWSDLMAPIVPWVYKGKLFLQVNKLEAKDQIVSYTWVPTDAAVTLARIGRMASDPKTLEAITCPVLLLHSRNDVAASPEAADKAVSAMRAVPLEKIWYESSNHHLLWDYDGENATNAICRFIASTEGGLAEAQ